MDEKALKEFQNAIDEVVFAPTKAAAAEPLRRLEFMASGMNSELDHYFRGKLREVINAAKSASGQVREKEHWKGVANSAWYIVENEFLNRISRERQET